MIRALPFLLLATPTVAEGFATTDLTTIEVNWDAVLGGVTTVQDPRPWRLRVDCPGCAGKPDVRVGVGLRTDSWEERLRADSLSMVHEEEAACQASMPNCHVEALDIAPAVGLRWYYDPPILIPPVFNQSVVGHEGDLLVIYASATDTMAAKHAADAVLAALLVPLLGD